jgi:hypothetical protein
VDELENEWRQRNTLGEAPWVTFHHALLLHDCLAPLLQVSCLLSAAANTCIYYTCTIL